MDIQKTLEEDTKFGTANWYENCCAVSYFIKGLMELICFIIVMLSNAIVDLFHAIFYSSFWAWCCLEPGAAIS